MPRVAIPGFAGPSNTLASPTVNADRVVNWYPETVDPGASVVQKWLRPTPGVRLFGLFPGSPMRGLFELDGRVFGVSGIYFGELLSDGTIINAALVANDAFDSSVSFASNGSAGHQLLFTSAGFGYIFDLITNVTTQITDPDFPANVQMCAFMDGYFLVSIRDTRRVAFSALEDGTSWDALDVFERSIASDNIVTMIRTHRDLLLLGSQTSESWSDTGDALTPFQPIQGVLMELGSAAPFGAVRADNSVVFLVKDERGTGIASRQEGYAAVRTTTYGIDLKIQGATNVAAAVAFAAQIDGHLWVSWNIDGVDTTLVWDVAEQQWHERALWDTTNCIWTHHIGKYHVFAFGTHLLGSRVNGWVYRWDAVYLNDEVSA